MIEPAPLIPSPSKRSLDSADASPVKIKRTKPTVRIPNFKDLFYKNNTNYTIEKTNDSVRLVSARGGIHEVLTPPFKAFVADIGPGGNKHRDVAWVDPNDSATWKFTVMGGEGGIDNPVIIDEHAAFKEYVETLQRKVTDALYDNYPKLRARAEKKAAADPANDTSEKVEAAAKDLFYKLSGKALKINKDESSPYFGKWQFSANTRVCYGPGEEKTPIYFDNKYRPAEFSIGRGPILQVVLSFSPYVMGNKYGISCRFRESAIVVHRAGGDADLTDEVLDNLQHPYSFTFKPGSKGKPDAVYIQNCVHRTPELAIKYPPSSTLGKFEGVTEKNAKIAMSCIESPEMNTFLETLRNNLVTFAMSSDEIMSKQKKEIIEVYGAENLEKELADACCMPNKNGVVRFSMRQFNENQDGSFKERYLIKTDADGDALEEDILEGALVRTVFFPTVYINANGEYGISLKIHDKGVQQIESGGGNDEDNATVSFDL